MSKYTESTLGRWRRLALNRYICDVRPRLPQALLEAMIRAYGAWVRLRLTPALTGWFGPRYRRSRERIDIDITWACNLGCEHCNRSCRQAPTQEGMTPGQVRRFLEESLARGYAWKQIHVIGGEPALHPQFLEILELLRGYRSRHAPQVHLKVSSNGYGEAVRAALSQVPEDIYISDTRKTSPVQPDFVPFNTAPIDTPFYRHADFRNGCPVTRDSGLGLSRHGYYPCVVAGGIDRVFGLGRGRMALPAVEDGMEEDLEQFCRFCGFFRLNASAPANGEPLMTEVWRAAYTKWRAGAPALPLYPEA